MTYTVKRRCGHDEAVQLRGAEDWKTEQLRRHGELLCAACFIKRSREPTP